MATIDPKNFDEQERKMLQRLPLTQQFQYRQLVGQLDNASKEDIFKLFKYLYLTHKNQDVYLKACVNELAKRGAPLPVVN